MRGKTYRRFSTEFKLGVVEAYLAGEGRLKGLATKAGVDHSLVHYWLKKYHAGELTRALQHEEESVETAQHIAALERKGGQLTMELDLLNRGLIAAPATSSGRSLIIAGPAASASGEDVARSAVVLDVFSRKVLGYAIGPTLDARLPLAALDAAIESRHPPPGCIHHSDRGSQGGFNRSSQHLQPRGVYGATRRMDEAIDREGGDALSGGSFAPARSRASVLGTDCDGNHQREGGRSRGRVASGRHSLVPAPWRDALADGETCWWPVSVVRGARRDRAAARTSGRGAGDRSSH